MDGKTADLQKDLVAFGCTSFTSQAVPLTLMGTKDPSHVWVQSAAEFPVEFMLYFGC